MKNLFTQAPDPQDPTSVLWTPVHHDGFGLAPGDEDDADDNAGDEDEDDDDEFDEDEDDEDADEAEETDEPA